ACANNRIDRRVIDRKSSRSSTRWDSNYRRRNIPRARSESNYHTRSEREQSPDRRHASSLPQIQSPQLSREIHVLEYRRLSSSECCRCTDGGRSRKLQLTPSE